MDEIDVFSPFRFYFSAYGVPTLIVVVTASTAGMNNYENVSFCFLASSSMSGSLGSFIGGLLAPCVLISTVMIGFGLSILCVLSTSPYKVTESETDARAKYFELDGKKSPKQVLFSLTFQFFLLTLCYITAGLQVLLRLEANHS